MNKDGNFGTKKEILRSLKEEGKYNIFPWNTTGRDRKESMEYFIKWTPDPGKS